VTYGAHVGKVCHFPVSTLPSKMSTCSNMNNEAVEKERPYHWVLLCILGENPNTVAINCNRLIPKEELRDIICDEFERNATGNEDECMGLVEPLNFYKANLDRLHVDELLDQEIVLVDQYSALGSFSVHLQPQFPDDVCTQLKTLCKQETQRKKFAHEVFGGKGLAALLPHRRRADAPRFFTGKCTSDQRHFFVIPDNVKDGIKNQCGPVLTIRNTKIRASPKIYVDIPKGEKYQYECPEGVDCYLVITTVNTETRKRKRDSE